MKREGKENASAENTEERKNAAIEQRNEDEKDNEKEDRKEEREERVTDRGRRAERRGGRDRDFWARALHLLACSGTRHTHLTSSLRPSSSLTPLLPPPLPPQYSPIHPPNPSSLSGARPPGPTVAAVASLALPSRENPLPCFSLTRAAATKRPGRAGVNRSRSSTGRAPKVLAVLSSSFFDVISH